MPLDSKVPFLNDKTAIRSLLNTDPRWCVYALGDLTPRMFAKCEWFTPDLTLVLKDYGTSILFAHGTGSIREALDHCTFPVHLQVQRDALEEIKRYATVTNEKQMLRMGMGLGLEGAEKKTRATESTENTDLKRLTGADVEALKNLYA